MHPTTASPRLQLILPSLVLGLCGGLLEAILIVLRKYSWNESGNLETGADFAWSVPLVHAIALTLAGLLILLADRLRSGWITSRAATWMVATLALWGALLRLPLYGAASFLLAAGMARPLSSWLDSRVFASRRSSWVAASVLAGLVASIAAGTSGRWAIAERAARAALPPSPPEARNVLLIVWDTVRASSLSAYGYPRDTTPNLARWARRGVRFERALSTAPWTFPSHASFFTGEWPYRINSQWDHRLVGSVPTLASHLASRGFETAGFAANTSYCSYENGLNRGFLHYEDFPLSVAGLLGRTAAGNWLLQRVVHRGDAYRRKWDNRQSRDGESLNQAFLRWFDGRRKDRPFLAFLNYFDAHDPYMPPDRFVGKFGSRPTSADDEQFLEELAHSARSFGLREAILARDCYDDCVAALDDQLGRLLAELDRRGTLANTIVVITSDHGESFGVHGNFGHGGSLYLDEVGVPLVIIGPAVPTDRVITAPVSLRDLPATVVDLARPGEPAPFPGRALSSLWLNPASGGGVNVSASFSELAHKPAEEERSAQGKSKKLQFSLVADGYHYVRDGLGREHLFDLGQDPNERSDVAGKEGTSARTLRFRRSLRDLLDAERGAAPIEEAYLNRFREELQAAIGEGGAGPEEGRGPATLPH
ncbi:sulfatase [Aquisphaera insulae]|uniref:sulfatase n=1 Tax=Aquisphaera insulae TaxID=2712864 RepID=UPI0013EA3958|nr:sulfatase [Aquisphaera insulae]